MSKVIKLNMLYQTSVSANCCTVEMDLKIGTVSIAEIDNPNNSIFMQGDSAVNFINDVENVFNTYNTGYHEAVLFVAHQYLYLLGY